MGLAPKNCITNASKICQFFLFDLHPDKLATLHATIGRTHYHFVLSHKTYQNQGICYATIANYCHITKTFVARSKFPHVKVARNTKNVGQAWFIL